MEGFIQDTHILKTILELILNVVHGNKKKINPWKKYVFKVVISEEHCLLGRDILGFRPDANCLSKQHLSEN